MMPSVMMTMNGYSPWKSTFIEHCALFRGDTLSSQRTSCHALNACHKYLDKSCYTFYLYVSAYR
jgi:hypothetical protein